MIHSERPIERGDLAAKIGENFQVAEGLQQKAWAIVAPILKSILDIESLGEASLYLDKLANVKYGDDLGKIVDELGKARGIRKKPGVSPEDTRINDSDRYQMLKLAKMLAGKYDDKDKEFASFDLEAQKAISEHVWAMIATSQEVVKDFDQSHENTLEAEKAARVKREAVIVSDNMWLQRVKEKEAAQEEHRGPSYIEPARLIAYTLVSLDEGDYTLEVFEKVIKAIEQTEHYKLGEIGTSLLKEVKPYLNEVNKLIEKKSGDALVEGIRSLLSKLENQVLFARENLDKQYGKGDTSLILGAYDGNIAQVNDLIARGADLNIRGEHGGTALLWALEQNKLEIAKVLIAAGADHHIANNTGETPLSVALKGNHKDIIVLIMNSGKATQDELGQILVWALKFDHDDIITKSIAAGVDFNIVSTNEETAVDITLRHKRYELLVALLDSGKISKDQIKASSINKKTKSGDTPLVTAAYTGNLEQTRALIKLGADLDASGENGGTALFWAINQGMVDVAVALLNAGADFHIANDKGDTPLSLALNKGYKEIIVLMMGSEKATPGDLHQILVWAIKQGHDDIAKKVITAGVNPIVPIENKKTAVDLAIQNKKYELLADWLESGKIGKEQIKDDVLNETYSHGDTALIQAAYFGRLNQAKALIKLGANLDIKGQNGGTALVWAIKQDKIDIAIELIRAGADPNIADNDRKTALLLAKNSDLIDALVDSGRLTKNGINRQDVRGDTIFIKAAFFGKLERVKKLIVQGARLDYKGENGATALLWALEQDHPEVANALLVAGADFHIANNNGVTPLSVAFKKNQVEIIELIRASGKATPDELSQILVWAVTNKIKTLVDDLIKEGAILDKALLLAAVARNSDAAIALINYGASPTVEDRNSDNILMLSILNNMPEVAEAAFHSKKMKGHLKDTNNSGKNALTLATEKGANHIVELLTAATLSQADVLLKTTGRHITIDKSTNPEKLKYALSKATKESSLTPEMMMMFISNKLDVNERYNNAVQSTMLMDAAGKGDLALVQTLLANGASPNLTDNKGHTAAFYAAQSTNPDIIDALVKAGANINLTGESKRGLTKTGYNTPFAEALNKGNSAVINRLIEFGTDPYINIERYADLKNIGTRTRHTLTLYKKDPIAYLLKHHKLEALPALLNTDEMVKKLIVHAAQKERADILLEIEKLHPKIFINAMKKDRNITNAICICISNDNKCDPVAKSDLLKKVIDANKNIKSVQPLIQNAVAKIGRQANRLTMLLVNAVEQLAKGKIVTFIHENELRPIALNLLLEKTINMGEVEAAIELLQAGADPNFKNADGVPMIALAFNKLSVELFMLLLEKGANPDTVIDGKNLIEIAYSWGDLNIVKKLLEKGANPNTKIDGESLLEIFHRESDYDTVKKMIDAGADLNIKTKAGQTFLEVMYDTYIGMGAGSEAERLPYKEILNTMLTSDKLDINLAGSNKQTILHQAVTLKASPEDIVLLVLCGANIKALDARGKKPLDYLVKSDNPDFVSLSDILKNGATALFEAKNTILLDKFLKGNSLESNFDNSLREDILEKYLNKAEIKNPVFANDPEFKGALDKVKAHQNLDVAR